MTKTKALIASLALVAVALAPLALAHNDTTDWTLEPAFAATPGHPNKKTDGANRVSGVYYKDVSLLADYSGSLPLGLARGACDLEVLSPGDGTADALDEPEVDGNTNGASLLGLTLFDDGGVGAACHRHSGYYAEASYNTAGCSYTPAFADDASGTNVWITTLCDYAHATSGPGLATYVLACADNLRTSDINGLVLCATNVLACLTAAGINCVLIPGWACGADDSGIGGLQAVRSGWGNAGVAFPSVPSPCSDADGAASVFVWTAVFVTTTPTVSVELSVPTVGVIY